MAEIVGLGGVVGAWLLLKVVRRKKNEDDGEEDWDALFEKARAGTGGSSSRGKSTDNGGRRPSLSSTEAVELRAKLDEIANAHRAAEQELDMMRASVKAVEAEKDRLLSEKDKLASDIRAKTRDLLKLTAEKRHAAQSASEAEDRPPSGFGPPQFLPGDGTPVHVEDAEPHKQEFEFSAPAKQPPPPAQQPWQSPPRQLAAPQQAAPAPALPQPPAQLGGDPKLLTELDDIRRELEMAMLGGAPLPLPYKDMLVRRMAAIQTQLQGQPTVHSLPQQRPAPPPAFPPAMPPAANYPPPPFQYPGAAFPPQPPVLGGFPPAMPPFGAVLPQMMGAVPPPYSVPSAPTQQAIPPYAGGRMPPPMMPPMGVAPQVARPPAQAHSGKGHGAPPHGGAASRASQDSHAGHGAGAKRVSQDHGAGAKRESQDHGAARARRMSQDEKIEILAKKKIGVVHKKATWGDEFENN